MLQWRDRPLAMDRLFGHADTDPDQVLYSLILIRRRMQARAIAARKFLASL